MDDIDNLKEEIRRYILSEFLPGELPSNLQDDTPLQTSGVLDSVATLQLASFIQKHYGIKLEAHEAGEEFDSIDSIVSVIRSKGGHAS
jgi:acyl carrier protein